MLLKSIGYINTIKVGILGANSNTVNHHMETREQTMKLSKTLKLVLAAISAIALISTAEAASFSITVDALSPVTAAIPPSSFNTVIPFGGGQFDIALTAMINVTPPPNNPALDLAGGVTYTGAGPATITLCVLGDGFVPLTPLSGGVGGSFHFDTAAGGTLFQTIMANGVPAVTNTVALNGTGTFASDLANITPSSAPFSLEDCITITFNGPGFVSFDAGVFRGVPDSGATAVLLGIGLLAIGGAAKFRKTKVTA